MEPNPRQTQIVEQARQSGRVTVEELSESFQVTPQTIRRDLNELCNRGLLTRVHGGAVPAHSVSNFGYEARRTLAAAEKRLIGQRTAALIPNNCSLIINIGTTTEQVARALTDHSELLVITNNLNVANTLTGNASIEIIIAGGLVRQSDGGVVGEAAVDFIRQFKVDYAIIGVSAIDEDGSLLDFDYREVKVAQAIMQSARQTLLVADSMKYERTAPVRIGHLSQLDMFVTDRPPPPRLRALCREHGVRVEVAEES